jgi:hypothetical protein
VRVSACVLYIFQFPAITGLRITPLSSLKWRSVLNPEKAQHGGHKAARRITEKSI